MDILQLMERILADPEEMEANQEDRQEKTADQQERMKALLGLWPWGEVTEGCQENLKAGLNKMEATDLRENPEGTEAAMGRQELREKGANVNNIGSLGDRYDNQRLAMQCR
jgi:hypothetical protein